jgi:hypothetical protein
VAKSDGTKRLEAVFAGLPKGQRAIAEAVRKAILAEASTLSEDVKWRAPVWSGRKLVFSLMVYDDHLNLGFWRGAELAERHPSIEGTGKSLRHIKLHAAGDAGLASVRSAIRDAVQLDAGE